MRKLLFEAGLFEYSIRPLQEALWFAAVSALTVGLQILTATDPNAVTAWDTWAIALGAGVGRAFLAALAGRKP